MRTNGYPRLLFVCAEFYPLAKTGGLADVCAALPRALAHEGTDARVMLPAYPSVLDSVDDAREVLRLPDGGRVLLARIQDNPLPIYLYEQPDLFRRSGGPYQDPERHDWPDNHLRYSAFCRAATALALYGDASGWAPDVVHAHDWHAALVPALLALHDGPRPPVVLTIHNLAYQGNFPLAAAVEADLPAALLGTGVAEFYGQLSFLKAGICTADRLTTVSPTYAREILTPEHGAGLDGVLRTRAADLVGIMNGVDADVWNPASDPYLPSHYTARDLSGKLACKAAVQEELGLEPSPEAPLICFVNRLTHQKMAETVLELLPAMADRGIQFVLHGQGDADLENAFAAQTGRSPQVVLRVGYQEDLAHRLTAGADISLIPSRFEPCGLTALYAMRYGALPVSRSVGGLADSVVDAGDATEPSGDATGFRFAEDGASGLLAGLDRARARFARRDSWQRMQRTAMGRDFSWHTAARHYLALYDELVPGIGFDTATQGRDAA
jgi:starch synthase